MVGTADPGRQQPDLVAEARFWREWNTSVYEKAHTREEAEAIAARVSPDPERIAAVLARAEAGAALARSSPAAAVSHDDLIHIHADAGRFFQSRLAGSWVPGYLASRHLDPVLLPSSPWKIGYAPDSWTALTEHLRGLGYSDEAMLRSGLVREGKHGLHDLFRDRLMIPVRRSADRVVIAFAGRRHPGHGDDAGPKYLNSPNTDLYVKGHVLAGLAEGKRHLDAGAQPVIVEGYTDAWAVSIAAPGRFVGLPLSGVALTGEHVAALARGVDLPERGVRVALDPDTAGRRAAVQSFTTLSAVTSDLTAVLLPDGHDPAEIFHHDGPGALREALAASTCPLISVAVHARMERWAQDGLLTTPEKQRNAIRAAAMAIASMPTPHAAVQATQLCELFSTRYGWQPQDVTSELLDAVDWYYDQPRQSGASAYAGLPEATSIVLARTTAPHQPGLDSPILLGVSQASKHEQKFKSRSQEHHFGDSAEPSSWLLMLFSAFR